MKWIKTCRGQFINLDHVAQFSFLRSGGVADNQIEMCIEYPNERTETHIIYKSDYGDLDEMITNQTDQFCPSPPGYFVLMYDKEDGEENIMRDAVLGWILDTELDGFHRVITTWDNHKSLGPCTAVLCADGTVVVPGSSRYESETSWLEAMRGRPESDKAA
jgi:hypothetical protein